MLHHFPFEKMEECNSEKKCNTETKTMTSYKPQNLCFYCKQFNHWQDKCRTRIQDNQPCTDSKRRKYWLR
jgi:hypothetical protein